jgi:hypothetical protein
MIRNRVTVRIVVSEDKKTTSSFTVYCPGLNTLEILNGLKYSYYRYCGKMLYCTWSKDEMDLGDMAWDTMRHFLMVTINTIMNAYMDKDGPIPTIIITESNALSELVRHTKGDGDSTVTKFDNTTIELSGYCGHSVMQSRVTSRRE